MYNLNVNLAETAANAANTLLVETNGPTPRTPEILNSLIAMSNPLDHYFGDGNRKVRNGPPTNFSTDSNSSSSSQFGSPTTNPPSIRHTCSQLIKAGLKLTIEQKRKHHNDSDDFLDLDQCSKRVRKTECSESEEDKLRFENGLTAEDEERRRRRRERNKIAATKCRLKKRERTANLVTESETLEHQNMDLKSQLQELQQQKLTLEEVLAHHRPTCQHNVKQATRDSLYRLPPVSSVIDNNHSYCRAAPLDQNYIRITQIPEYHQHRPSSVSLPNGYMRNNGHYKTPSIVVEEVDDNCQPHLTNLDNHVPNGYYNQCHNNYSNNQNYNNSGIGNGCMA